jgi:hypothetical protein
MNRAVVSLLALTLMCVSGQESRSAGDLFSKAPQGVEEALRERVKQFYLLHIEGKFRQAEAFVCEESKDLFYNSDKPRYTSFDLIKVSFEDGFQKAKVVSSLGAEMMVGTTKAPTNVPKVTTWQVEQGKWCNLILPPSTTGYVTPFGIMKPGPDSQGAMTPTTAPPVTASSVRGGVRVSTNSVNLSAEKAGQASIEIENRLPGGVSLKLEAPGVKGIEWLLGKEDLESGQKAILQIRYSPVEGVKVPEKLTAQIRVSPISSVLPITVYFTSSK